jgi:hypothetical protein
MSRQRNESLSLAHDAGPGKSVSVRHTTDGDRDATKSFGVQAQLFDARAARITIVCSYVKPLPRGKLRRLVRRL